MTRTQAAAIAIRGALVDFIDAVIFLLVNVRTTRITRWGDAAPCCRRCGAAIQEVPLDER